MWPKNTFSWLRLPYSVSHQCVSYGLIVWGLARSFKEVLRLQKSAVRIMTSSRHLDHSRPLFRRPGILTVYDKYVLISLAYIMDSFNASEDIHSYNIRGRSALEIPRCRLSKNLGGFPVLRICYQMAWEVTRLDR